MPAGLGCWKQDASESDQRDLAVILGSSSGKAAAAARPSPAPVKISDLVSPPGRKLLAAGGLPAGLAEWLRTATPEQKQQLALLGFDEATLQTATPEQLQQLEQKLLGLPDPTAHLPPTLQQVAGLRRLQGADTLPGLTEWAKTAPPTVQDDLTKLGLGAASQDHPAVTLQQVADPKNAAAATTSDPNSAIPAATSTTSETAGVTGTVQQAASTAANASTPLRRKLAVAAHPSLRGLCAAQH